MGRRRPSSRPILAEGAGDIPGHSGTLSSAVREIRFAAQRKKLEGLVSYPGEAAAWMNQPPQRLRPAPLCLNAPPSRDVYESYPERNAGFMWVHLRRLLEDANIFALSILIEGSEKI